jgi:CheY-like chemotaxis protein
MQKKNIEQNSGNIAHDFNNILTIIHTCSQLVLAEISDNKKACKYMDKILMACEKASALIDVHFPTTKRNEKRDSRARKPVCSKNKIVLLVDDEKDLLNTVQLLLEHIGYTVFAFENPVSALLEFKKNPEKFDIVIADVAMPEMDGKQLAQQIKEIRNDLPILISSGDNNHLSEREMNQLGINGFLMKPFLKKDLSESIQQALSVSDK